MMSLFAGGAPPSQCIICGKPGVSFLNNRSSDDPGGESSRSRMTATDDAFLKWSRACSSSVCKLFGWKECSEADALRHVFERSPYCVLCIGMIREVNWVYREMELVTMRISSLRTRLMNKLGDGYPHLKVLAVTETEELPEEERISGIWRKILEQKGENAGDRCKRDLATFVSAKDKHHNLAANSNTKTTFPGHKRNVRKPRTHLELQPKEDSSDSFFNPIIVKVDSKCKPPSVKCTEISCNRKFLSNETMKVHVRKEHEGCELPFDCRLCKKSFATKGAFGIHMMRHDTPSLICELCGRQFTVKRDLKDHVIRMHSSRPAYSCTLCSFGLVSRETLEQHESQHGSETEFPFICVICRKNHANSTDLQQHVVETHISNILRCDQCGKTFWALESLRKDLLTHKDRNPKYSCAECEYVATSQSKLNDHMGKHSVERNLVCPVCGSTFKYKKSLSRHMRSHTNETPYACSICGRGFRDMQKKKRHEEIHSGNKYPCQICKKVFNAQQNLQQHLRVVHTPKDAHLKKPRSHKSKGDDELLLPPKSRSVKTKHRNEYVGLDVIIPKTKTKRTKTTKLVKTAKILKGKSSRKREAGLGTAHSVDLKETESTVKTIGEPETFATATTDLSYMDPVPLQEVEITYQDASSFEFIGGTPLSNAINVESSYAPAHHDETYHHQGVHHLAVLQHENSSGIPVPVTITEMQGLQIVNSVVTDNNFYF